MHADTAFSSREISAFGLFSLFPRLRVITIIFSQVKEPRRQRIHHCEDEAITVLSFHLVMLFFSKEL